ncbi:hypothetical protein JIQ42_04474 [Leishmania sp. Namibia]|uniref:hypothetical protein n=1 Tax=Leishmania sp. Namibia TaxID=2802991 RepID=UPI001B41E9A2|nr:hypothetical protein JIQ42_04474 [Leishmania sp. Namibia]
MAACYGAMNRMGDVFSPVSQRKPQHPSDIDDADIPANPLEEEIFSDDQIQEIEQLLSRICDNREDHEMMANSSEALYIPLATGVPVERKDSCERDNVTYTGRRGRRAEGERERIWKAHIADVHACLEQKKMNSANAILNERRFREKSRQQHHKNRAQSHTRTPKLLSSLPDLFSEYTVQAGDMALFVEERTR